MRESRWLWPRWLLLCVSVALVPGMASLAQDRQLVVNQIVVHRADSPTARKGSGADHQRDLRWVVIKINGQQYPDRIISASSCPMAQ